MIASDPIKSNMSFGLKFSVLLKSNRIYGNADVDELPTRKFLKPRWAFWSLSEIRRMIKRSRKLDHLKTKMYLTQFRCGRMTDFATSGFLTELNCHSPASSSL